MRPIHAASASVSVGRSTHFVPVADGQICVERTGSGPGLLLVPGFGGSARFWDKQVDSLSARFSIITLDHRGCGRSSHSRIEYSMEQMLDDVIGVIDHLGVDKTAVVGHSTGGAIAQLMAVRHSHRISHLVLSASWAAIDVHFRRLLNFRLDVLRRMGVDAFVRLSSLLLHPPTYLNDREAEIAQRESEQIANVDPEILESRLAALLRFESLADLPRITVPTLVIVAKDDFVTPIHQSLQLARAIPGAELVTLDCGGHYAAMARPEDYNRALLSFLSRPPAESIAGQASLPGDRQACLGPSGT